MDSRNSFLNPSLKALKESIHIWLAGKIQVSQKQDFKYVIEK